MLWYRWGQHIVLLLDGYRNTIRHSLPLNFTVQDRSGGHWRGEAIIPVDYLPVNVTRMNAYAIHGSGSERVYEALYPVPAANITNETEPNLWVSKKFELKLIKLFFFNYSQPPPGTLSTNKHDGAIARNWFAVGHLGRIFARVKSTFISQGKERHLKANNYQQDS